MLSKIEWMSSLIELGFVKDLASRTDGSHIRYHHSKYINLFVGIDDHKNTKEMSFAVHKELLQTVTMLVWLQCKNQDNVIDFKKVKLLTKKLPQELQCEITKKLKNYEKEKMNLLLKIIPKRLLKEVGKISEEITEQDVINYIKSN